MLNLPSPGIRMTRAIELLRLPVARKRAPLSIFAGARSTSGGVSLGGGQLGLAAGLSPPPRPRGGRAPRRTAREPSGSSAIGSRSAPGMTSFLSSFLGCSRRGASAGSSAAGSSACSAGASSAAGSASAGASAADSSASAAGASAGCSSRCGSSAGLSPSLPAAAASSTGALSVPCSSATGAGAALSAVSSTGCCSEVSFVSSDIYRWISIGFGCWASCGCSGPA